MTINILELSLVIFIAALGLAFTLLRIAAIHTRCSGNCNQGRDCDCVPTLEQEVHP